MYENKINEEMRMNSTIVSNNQCQQPRYHPLDSRIGVLMFGLTIHFLMYIPNSMMSSYTFQLFLTNHNLQLIVFDIFQLILKKYISQ